MAGKTSAEKNVIVNLFFLGGGGGAGVEKNDVSLNRPKMAPKLVQIASELSPEKNCQISFFETIIFRNGQTKQKTNN